MVQEVILLLDLICVWTPFLNLTEKPVSDFFEESEAKYKSQGVKEAWMYTPEGGETLPQLEKRAGEFFQVCCKA